MNSEEKYPLIDDYLKNRLSESERQEFEQKLQQDESLREALSLRKLSNKLIIQNRLLEVKQLSLETKKSAKAKRIYRPLAGGLILVGAMLGTYLWFSSSPKTIEKAPSSSNSISPKQEVPVIKEEEVLSVPEKISESKSTPKEVISKTEKTSDLQPSKEQEEVHVQETKHEEVIHALPSQPVEVEKIPIPALKKPVTEVKKSCANVTLEADISANGTCPDDQNGSLQVNNVKGGAEPYHYKVISEKNNRIYPQNQLPIGSYIVFITDRNKCEKKVEHVLVKELSCLEEFKFNPFAGETWELAPHSSLGSLIIHEKGGEVYFQTKIESGEAFKWNGTSSKGEMKHGLYIFTVTYQDETKKQGEIVLIR